MRLRISDVGLTLMLSDESQIEELLSNLLGE
jgi:hypothetical protein